MKNLLKHLRAAFWFIQVDSWRIWKDSLRGALPRYQVFRNRRYPKGYRNIRGEDIGGSRIYTPFRWGGAILGLQIGDRGGSREYVRRRLGLSK
jgi:hypothetical protein